MRVIFMQYQQQKFHTFDHCPFLLKLPYLWSHMCDYHRIIYVILIPGNKNLPHGEIYNQEWRPTVISLVNTFSIIIRIFANSLELVPFPVMQHNWMENNKESFVCSSRFFLVSLDVGTYIAQLTYFAACITSIHHIITTGTSSIRSIPRSHLSFRLPATEYHQFC